MNEIITVFAGAIFYFALGMFWYSPVLFGNIWMKAKGFLHEDMKNKKMPKYAFPKAILNAFIVSFAMTVAGNFFMFENIEKYLGFSVIAALFVLTNEFSKHIWEQEKFVLLILNSLFTLCAYAGIVTIIYYI